MKIKHSLYNFCLAAPRSGEGKTTISIGIMRALARRGLCVQAFKCGPDYIDTTYHTESTGRKAYNIDTWMMGHEGVRALWQRHITNVDAAICEGVMGLFDGGASGTIAGSTVDCAKALNIPIILICNARGMAHSIAALVEGFHHKATRLGATIVGIIANNVGSARHVDILHQALSKADIPLPPLLGTLPRDPVWTLPERHLGLVPLPPAQKQDTLSLWLDALAQTLEENINMEQLLALTCCPRVKTFCSQTIIPEIYSTQTIHTSTRRMGIAKDAAFCFYYEENQESLRQQGWELIPFSPLKDTVLPPQLDALYIGGGYPEIFAAELSANTAMRHAIAHFAANNGEIYAECGGYMYLCTQLDIPTTSSTVKEQSIQSYPMCDIIKGTAHMGTRVRALGYREVRMLGTPPLGLTKKYFRGHEFHWSSITLHKEYPPLCHLSKPYIPKVQSDIPIDKTDMHGVDLGNVKASYIHLYWGCGAWSQKNTLQANKEIRPVSPRGQLILLNGPSSAGKTTLAQTLQTYLYEKKHIVSMYLAIDALLHALPNKPTTVITAVQKTSVPPHTAPTPIVHAFHACIAEAINRGAWVIADHVIGEDRTWFADLSARVYNASILPVQVTCAPEILQQREETRADRVADWSHAARQAKHIHSPLPHEITVDTSTNIPSVCAEYIVRTLFT